MFVLLAIAAVLLCTVGWGWFNQQLRDYYRWRLAAQLEESAEALPEITDHEALMRREVTGTNGWEHVRDGNRHWFLMLEEHRTGELYEPTWILSIPGAHQHGDGTNSWNEQQEEWNFSPVHFDQALRLTAPIAVSAEKAVACDCIVHVQPEWWQGEPRVNFGYYIGILATRVMMLDYLDNTSQRDTELRVMMRLLSGFESRFSKMEHDHWQFVRNECLEFCIIPLLEKGRLDTRTKQLILDCRWRTPGNDKKLWLNNAAWTYKHLSRILEDDSYNFYVSHPDRVPDFPKLRLHYYPAFIQWMEVCTGNALDSRNGELDLRDDEWVRDYRERFEWGYNPINQVAG